MVDAAPPSTYLHGGPEAPAARRTNPTVKPPGKPDSSRKTRSSRSCGKASTRDIDRMDDGKLAMQTPTLPATRELAKQRAHAIRAEHTARGVAISHSAALEKVAAELGYRDWNTASARLSNLPEVPLQVGDRVAGRYLKQPFAGRVLGVREVYGGGSYEVVLQFDTPVDVVSFDSFSAFRSRVTATIDADGVSASRTSDGHPHLQVARR